MDAADLALRVGLSLACVLGLVWLFSKGLLKGGARRGGVAGRVQVLARQPLSRSSSLTVVQVGDRTMVLGVTEQQVTLLLSETPTEALPAPPLPASPLPSADAAVVERQQRTTVTPLVLTPSAASGEPGTRLALAVPQQRGGYPGRPEQRGPLAGSALSPATWSQALEALRERTTRR